MPLLNRITWKIQECCESCAYICMRNNRVPATCGLFTHNPQTITLHLVRPRGVKSFVQDHTTTEVCLQAHFPPILLRNHSQQRISFNHSWWVWVSPKTIAHILLIHHPFVQWFTEHQNISLRYIRCLWIVYLWKDTQEARHSSCLWRGYMYFFQNWHVVHIVPSTGNRYESLLPSEH